MDALDRNCANCAHFDGDGYCALPRKERKLAGFIFEPESVVCTKHEAQRDPEVLEGIAYENKLSRASGTY